MTIAELKAEVKQYRIGLRDIIGKAVKASENGPIGMALIDALVKTLETQDQRIASLESNRLARHYYNGHGFWVLTERVSTYKENGGLEGDRWIGAYNITGEAAPIFSQADFLMDTTDDLRLRYFSTEREAHDAVVRAAKYRIDDKTEL